MASVRGGRRPCPLRRATAWDPATRWCHRRAASYPPRNKPSANTIPSTADLYDGAAESVLRVPGRVHRGHAAATDLPLDRVLVGRQILRETVDEDLATPDPGPAELRSNLWAGHRVSQASRPTPVAEAFHLHLRRRESTPLMSPESIREISSRSPRRRAWTSAASTWRRRAMSRSGTHSCTLPRAIPKKCVGRRE